VPDILHSAKIFALGKDLVSGSVLRYVKGIDALSLRGRGGELDNLKTITYAIHLYYRVFYKGEVSPSPEHGHHHHSTPNRKV
jgi:hypothetical protein